MPGKPRTSIGTYGAIHTSNLPSGMVQAMTRFRDWDGRLRRVTATGASRAKAEAALREKLVDRDRFAGTGGAVTADSGLDHPPEPHGSMLGDRQVHPVSPFGEAARFDLRNGAHHADI